MGLNRFLYQYIRHYRLEPDNLDADKEGFVLQTYNFKCVIDQRDPEVAAASTNALFQAFDMYCEIDADVMIGDKFIDDDDNIYFVRGVIHRQLAGKNQHRRVTLERGVA